MGPHSSKLLKSMSHKHEFLYRHLGERNVVRQEIQKPALLYPVCLRVTIQVYYLVGRLWVGRNSLISLVGILETDKSLYPDHTVLKCRK